MTCEGSAPAASRGRRRAAREPDAVADTFNGLGVQLAERRHRSRRRQHLLHRSATTATDPDGGARQDKQAVYRLPPGAATRSGAPDFDFNKPNGIALSPDGNTLYVVDNGAGTRPLCVAQADGTLNGEFAKFADVEGGDGMAVDDRGNLYVAATAGIIVFDKAGAGARHHHDRAGTPSNCTFGGADRKTLYITSNIGGGDAATGLYSIKLNVPGLP